MSQRSDYIDKILQLVPRDGEHCIDRLALLTITDRDLVPSLAQQEYVSKYRRSLFNTLLKRQEEVVKKGGMKTFEVTDRRFFKLSWILTEAGLNWRRQWLAQRAFVYEWISSISDRDYEKLGGVLMQRLGATRVHITPSGNEYGIDFLAIVPAYSRSSLFVSGGRGLRIVGQSKLYKTAVQREKIQAFNDTMSSIRNNRSEMLCIIPAWFRSSDAPMLGCFIAHSGYQSGAQIMAEQNGHILLDSMSLSEILGRKKNSDKVHGKADVQKELWIEIAHVA